MSFALPVKDDDSCEDSQVTCSETMTTASQLKTSSSSPFTAVKQVVHLIDISKNGNSSAELLER